MFFVFSPPFSCSPGGALAESGCKRGAGGELSAYIYYHNKTPSRSWEFCREYHLVWKCTRVATVRRSIHPLAQKSSFLWITNFPVDLTGIEPANPGGNPGFPNHWQAHKKNYYSGFNFTKLFIFLKNFRMIFVSNYRPKIESSVLRLTTRRAGMKPAITVAMIKKSARSIVAGTSATKIPSENGKLIGFCSINGTKNP